MPVKVRSMLSSATIDEKWLTQTLVVGKQFAEFFDRHGLADGGKLAEAGLMRGVPGEQRLLLSIVGIDRLEKLFAKLFDQNEFLSRTGYGPCLPSSGC